MSQSGEVKSQVLGVIPARWGSSRFPGKPLHLIAGKELVLRVWDQCQKCHSLHDVVIATDDERIYNRAIEYGAKAVMTDTNHPTGTDRIAEVIEQFPEHTHAINIQGDEPLISPELIDQLANELRQDTTLEMVTAATELTDDALVQDSNIVKVVFNQKNDAMYFSRSPIPFQRDVIDGQKFYRHLGIYGYQSDFVQRFVKFPNSTIEQTESLEQLRALDHGATIRIVVTDDPAIGVDTPEQAQQIEQLIINGNH